MRLVPLEVSGTVDAVLALLEQLVGGTWKAADAVGSAERAQLEDQVRDLPGFDLALLGEHMRAQSTGDRLAMSRQIVARPGELIAAHNSAQRWNDERIERERRAAAMSAELQRQMELAGLTPTKGTA